MYVLGLGLRLGLSIRTEGRAPLTERNCSIQVPNEVPREGSRGRGNEMFNLNCQRIEQRETIKNSCSLIKKRGTRVKIERETSIRFVRG